MSEVQVILLFFLKAVSCSSFSKYSSGPKVQEAGRGRLSVLTVHAPQLIRVSAVITDLVLSLISDMLRNCGKKVKRANNFMVPRNPDLEFRFNRRSKGTHNRILTGVVAHSIPVLQTPAMV
jgi:hypothetical protein